MPLGVEKSFAPLSPQLFDPRKSVFIRLISGKGFPTFLIRVHPR
jgi:hypothetical protein